MNHMYERTTVFSYSDEDMYARSQKTKDKSIKHIIDEWIESPKGKWCVEHAKGLKILEWPNYVLGLHKVAVSAVFEPRHATMYRLKWSKS